MILRPLPNEILIEIEIVGMRIAFNFQEAARFSDEVHEVEREQTVAECKEVVRFGHDAFDSVEESIQRLPFRIHLQGARTS